MRVLFLTAHAPHQIEGASSRYRVYQYLEFFNAHGIITDVLIPPRGNRPRQLAYMPAVFAHARCADLLFLQKKLLPRVMLDTLIRVNPRVIFDFDDALFVVNPGTPLSAIEFRWVKPRLDATLRAARHIVAGNRYLADYASRLNPRVSVVPTALDLAQYSSRTLANPAREMTIGWVGSGAQHVLHLALLVKPLAQLASRVGFRFRIVGAMNSMRLRELFAGAPYEVEFTDWIDPSELPNVIEQFDIGVMPLVDDAWSLGKCGFKALQYMACGVATVVSPVGINVELVTDGLNGFTARDEDEWVAKLAKLANDGTLRARIGAAGRKTVEEHYSLERTGEKLIRLFEETAAAS